MSKITQYGQATLVDPTEDLVLMVDISDTTMAPTGTDKKAFVNQIRGNGQDTVSVRDYGALDDGVSDATAACQAALNAAAGGTCQFPDPENPYIISAPLVVPNATSVIGPICTPGTKGRVQTGQTPPTIQVANGANLTAVFTDAEYMLASGAPTMSYGILVNGIGIQGNAANQTGGTGHGFAFCGGGLAIVNCMTWNTRGSGFLYSSASAAGVNSSVVSPLVMAENIIQGCRAYMAGAHPFWIHDAVNLLTDGYFYDNVCDQNFTQPGFYGLFHENVNAWRIVHNHMYGLAGNGYGLYNCTNSWVESNQCNFGRAGVVANTYLGYDVELSPFGATVFSNNHTQVKEGGIGYGGAGGGTYVHFSFTPQTNAQTNQLNLSGNQAHQAIAGTGTSTAFLFSAGTSGTLEVRDLTSICAVGTSISRYPEVTGNVNFHGFRGDMAEFQPAAPPGTASVTLVMCGFQETFIPAVSGTMRVTVTGSASSSTGVATVSVQAQFGTGTAPVTGAALAGTQVGTTQVARGQQATSNLNTGFTIQGLITNLVPGTTYWLDLAYATGNAADQANLGNVDILLEEVS